RRLRVWIGKPPSVPRGDGFTPSDIGTPLGTRSVLGKLPPPSHALLFRSTFQWATGSSVTDLRSQPLPPVRPRAAAAKIHRGFNRIATAAGGGATPATAAKLCRHANATETQRRNRS